MVNDEVYVKLLPDAIRCNSPTMAGRRCRRPSCSGAGRLGGIRQTERAARTKTVRRHQADLERSEAQLELISRYTRSNGITEGFHTKIEVLQRQSCGFRNFQNYRLRVKVMCS
jgi:hypothetical protein